MDKPFGILVIVLAMFVTLGALAAGLLPPTQAVPTQGRPSAESAAGKTPGDTPATQGVTHAPNEAANPETERAQAVKSGN
jgi:hypothetical protein